MRKWIVACLLTLLFSPSLLAQAFTSSACTDDEGNTNDSWLFGHLERICELRSVILPVIDGQVRLSGQNGGIEVIGEERRDIALEARVVAQDESREKAELVGRAVKIITTGTIHAEGPHTWGFSRSSWSVNYRLRVPRHIAAPLHTQNGGIRLTNVDGEVHADTTNGGLTLDALGGDVHASTVNGGLHVKLDGTAWKGSGLVARATNGGISVKAPENYSAHLVAQTVNGGISVGFPITIQGKIHNHIDTNIGQGGATLHFETVNGGVSIHPN